ncbi:MAG: T9SS type A sorting domain-containing protein [Bacteroidales bacterium]|nr:T9SS type A sorting domain-containing protein [Bacteroidales bacterium]
MINRQIQIISFLILFISVYSQGNAAITDYTLSENVQSYTSLTNVTTISFSSQVDANSAVIPIGFDFSFDGNQYSNFSVNSNGLIKLGSTAISGNNSANDLNNNIASGNYPVIAPYWDELMLPNSNSSVAYTTTGTAGNRILKIEFRNVGLLQGNANNPKQRGEYSFQVWLYESNGNIEFYYNKITPDNKEYGSIGLASNNGTIAADANYNKTTTDPANHSFPATDVKLIFSPDIMAIDEQETIHPDLSDVAPGSTNKQILRVNIKTTGKNQPITIDEMAWNLNGTDDLSDIESVKLFSTNSSSTFGTSNQTGNTINSPNNTFSFNNLSLTLAEGDNYFWLVYDISSNAPLGNFVDGEYLYATDTQGNQYAPAIGDPSGSIEVSGPMSFEDATAFHQGQDLYIDSTDNPVLRLEINTTGAQNPLEITEFTFSTSNSDNPAADITQAQLFYTGSNTTFNTNQQYGNAVSGPNGNFSFQSTLQLEPGKNVFWLTYDIAPSTSATPGNIVDALAESITIDGNTETIANPDSPNDNLIVEVDFQWVGGHGKDPVSWNNKKNWNPEQVPSATDNVVIPDNVNYMPEIYSGDQGNCNNMSIKQGAELTNNGTLNVNSSIQNNGTINQLPNAVSYVTGNITNDGSANLSSIVVLNGNKDQSIHSTNELTFEEFVIDKSGGNVLAHTNIRVKNQMNIQNGKLVLGNQDLIINKNADIINASNSSYIIATGQGRLKQKINQTGTSRNFPVGNNNSYTPFEITINSASLDPEASIAINITSNAHPEMKDLSFLKHYWSVKPIGISGNINYNVSYQFDPNDIIGILPELMPTKENNGTVTQGGYVDANNYEAIWTNITSFSNFSLMNQRDDDPLPVEWLEFQAKNINNGVELLWKTASETNNEYFSVEHSEDGHHFEVIGKIDGAGNSNGVKTYTYNHTPQSSGTHYYRIKQVDYDGQYEYSSIETATIEQNESITVYPNPAVVNQEITLDIPETIEQLRIVNASGKTIKHITQPGNKEKFLPPASGMYFIRFSDSQQTQTKKLLIH